MCPRPRTVSDAAILDATSRVIGRVGPAKLTLALVAREVGLSAATLVQRFGSKRGLLIALGKSGEGGDLEAYVAALRKKHKTALRTLREYLLCFSRMASTPDELANHLAAFQMDVVDPELREIALGIQREQEAVIRTLLVDALDAGELRGCDAKRLAPVLLVVAQGALLGWALHRKGTARNFLAKHVDVVLEPYLDG